MAGVAIVVFSDLVDSTALLASLGDDRMDRIRRAHVTDVSDAVLRNRGRVVKTLGDGVMSSFESALGALRASAAIQAAVERLDEEEGGIGLAARVGVAAGEPIPDGDDLHGMPVVIASRLSSAADTAEVLVQDVVQALVASRDGIGLGPPREYELKGVPAPIRASNLLWREVVHASGDEPGPGGGDGSAGPAPRLGLSPSLLAFAEQPLIGRDREIATLREETAPRPGRRAVVILGEPGIGKTRHAAAAAADAHARGATVVFAQCPPESAVPFEPWVRAIGELAAAGDEAWRGVLAGAAGPELAALVPELDQEIRPEEQMDAGAMIAAEGARYRLLRGIGACLGRAAGGGPLLVVLDDAQWCDPASAQALKHLLDRPPADEFALVVTAREGELGRGHSVSKALADLRRTDDLSELRLAGLDATGMAELVSARVGRSIGPALARRLLDRTSGNPFFAAELVRDLDGRGALQDAEALDAAPAPDAVAGLVEERLAQLHPATERLLTAMAAMGPSAPVALAGRAAGLDREEAVRAARDALAERLVEEAAKAEPTIAFTHALIREALIADLSEVARARLHLAVAEALEESLVAEPAELARHYRLAGELADPERTMTASRAAATAAAEGHDHETAAMQLRHMLSLIPVADPRSRGSVLLELGEQDLLSADLVKARDSFRGAIEAARLTGDRVTLARAALGFAGGDIGFGWESGGDDEAVALLNEGLEALGEDEPRLALQMIFRLSYLLVFTDDDEAVQALPRRAQELAAPLGDAEARVLGSFTGLVVSTSRRPDPLRLGWLAENMQSMLEVLEWAEECARDDLRFRVVQHSSWVYYGLGRIAECEQAIERAEEIAVRLGSPRFTWEVELNRAMRHFDAGRGEEASALSRRAGARARRMRPDLQVLGELTFVTLNEWIYGGETEIPRRAFEALDTGIQRGAIVAGAVAMQALDGQHEIARRALGELLDGNLEGVRCPDAHLPAAVCFLAEAAIAVRDVEAGERLRAVLETTRGLLIPFPPATFLGFLPEAYIGRLELLAGNVDEAVVELRTAVAKAEDFGLVWAQGWIRADLARAMHRSGNEDEALRVLAEAESIADRHGVGWASLQAARARAEIEGLAGPALSRSVERSKPVRALAARGGRRAFAAMVRDRNEAEIERRLAEPRRQRALLRAMARSFQPARAAGFTGTIVFELEPYAIEPPPDAPWRWAIEADANAGRARLVEPAPLDPAVTIHLGLADWARVMAGLEDSLSAMVGGRCVVEGDVSVAARLETMFGIR
jgi:eukaryotic-like serine/threonine-protein kinase